MTHAKRMMGASWILAGAARASDKRSGAPASANKRSARRSRATTPRPRRRMECGAQRVKSQAPAQNSESYALWTLTLARSGKRVLEPGEVVEVHVGVLIEPEQAAEDIRQWIGGGFGAGEAIGERNQVD